MKRRRNKLRMLAHFVWATENRQPFSTDEIEERVYRYIHKACQDSKCDVLAIGGLPDHIHLLVALGNTISLSDLMRNVKGGSSRFITEQLKQGGWFKWQAHYAAFAVSPQDKDGVTAYIQNQKQRHAEGKLWDSLEETYEEYDDGKPDPLE
jgi:putative transposase